LVKNKAVFDIKFPPGIKIWGEIFCLIMAAYSVFRCWS